MLAKKVITSIFVLCFVAAVYAAPRVIGGSNAPDGKYPYVVSLRLSGSHFCGGSIINKRWILTAAHCALAVRSLQSLTVVAGTNKLRGGSQQVYHAEYVVAHKDFNYQLSDPDVGLIRLDEDIEFVKKVQPIKLASNNFTKADYPSLLAGWGTTKLGGSPPNNLQEIELKVIDHNLCKEKWSKAYPGKSVTGAHVCTLNKAGEGACHGDSGSPLVADGEQIGLASFVVPCAEGEPDVFTRVYSYVQWIDETISEYESKNVL